MVLASRGETLRLIEGSSKRYHSVLSAKLMRILARTFHEDEGEWELVGLLHDLDHDLVHGDMSRHGMVAAEMLKGKLSESCLHAIRAHDRRTGVEPQGILDECGASRYLGRVFDPRRRSSHTDGRSGGHNSR